MILRTHSLIIRFVIFALILFFSSTNLIIAKEKKIRRGTPEWYQQGPQKEWSDSDFKKYYRWRSGILQKQVQTADDDQILRRQKAIINGNKITAEIWNYASISSPGNRITDIVWEGLGYGYEFGPFICAEVEVTPWSHVDAYIKRDENGDPIVNAEGDTMWVARVISDGLVSYPERSPDYTEFWGWEPLAYSDLDVPYADPTSDFMPTSNDIDRNGDGKPDSWPKGWYNPNMKEYVWPGALRQGSSNAEVESFFVVDDRSNKEFEYYPFPDDSSRKGLGLEIECRYYQWSNPLAEDIIFLIYKVTNKSPKDLNNVIFGMWGDPHIGGPSNYSDDLSFFDRDINMVYSWDEDEISDKPGIKPGYFGYKFLESPGDPHDGIDNDNDGMIDESRADGVDNDDDWNPEKDDVGLDGVPNTVDEGEGDGIPTAGDPFDIRKPGEPHFEWTDLDEADMVGLTGFAAPPFQAQNAAYNDHYFFEHFLTPGVFDSANYNQAGDYVFLYSSGPIIFRAGEARRFSIALLIGQDLPDLILNAQTAQDIYEKNYQFAKPPEKPNVTAVPGDEQVTLYWDDVAESSVDPISEKEDFEGYVIYRSTDPGFLDQQTITDANGSKFLFEPLKMVTGAPARFDLDNEYSGLSTIPFTGRGIYYRLGSNTGLRHSFIDSNNVINGQTYYYAVVSYDHGDDSLKIAPAECSKTITVNPERNEFFMDVNTLRVIPRVSAAGFGAGNVDEDWIAHLEGTATGDISIEVLDPRLIEDNNEFQVSFTENPTTYYVEDMTTIQEVFIARIGQYVRLKHRNINAITFSVTDTNGTTTYADSLDYIIIPETGQVMADSNGSLDDGQPYLAHYRYFGVAGSTLLDNQENNPVFDGLKIYAKNNVLALDESLIGWSISSTSNYQLEIKPYNLLETNKYGADYEIRFLASPEKKYLNPRGYYVASNFEVWEVTENRLAYKHPVLVIDDQAKPDSVWGPNDISIIMNYLPIEYITDGDMGSDTSWIVNGNWAVNENSYNIAATIANGTDQKLAQMVSAVSGKVYSLSYEVKSNSLSGGIPGQRLQLADGTDYIVRNNTIYLDEQVGEHRIEFRCNNAGDKRLAFLLNADAISGAISIDNVSLLMLEMTWQFVAFEPLSGDTIPPVEGDKFYIATTRPFATEDVYRFTTFASKINEQLAKENLDLISVVPNPYMVTNVLEPLDLQNRLDRGPRRLYFNHLPKDCTIRIYTLSGELVDILEHHSEIDDGKEFWDLTTKDNFPIAFGIYIYHVDASELGEKIGRFAVIK